VRSGFGNKHLNFYLCLPSVVALRAVDRTCYVLTQWLCDSCCFRVEGALPSTIWSHVSSIALNWTSDLTLIDFRNLLDGSPGLGRRVFFGGSEDSVLSRLGAQLGIRPQEHSYAHLRALRLTKKYEKEDEGGGSFFLLSSLHELGFVGLQRLYLEKCARGDLGELQVPKLRCIFIDGGKVQGRLRRVILFKLFRANSTYQETYLSSVDY